MFKWMSFFKKDKNDPSSITPTDTNISMNNPPPTTMTNANVLSKGMPLSSLPTTNNTIPVNSFTTAAPSPISSNIPLGPSTESTSTLPSSIDTLSTHSHFETPTDTTSINTPTVTISQDVNMVTSIALEIKKLPLFASIGDTIISEVSSSGFLSATTLNYILEHGQKLIDNSSASSESTSSISQHVSAINEMLKLPPLDSSLNHDNLVQSNITSTVQHIISYYNVCEKSISLVPNENIKLELSNFSSTVSGINTTFTNLISVFKNFKASEHNLRQEIEAYTKAVTQIQGQGINVDWGGKKEAFEQKNAELTTRRNAYVEQEKQINLQITNLSNSISSFHPMFIEFLNKFKGELSSLDSHSDTNIYSDQIASYIQYSDELKSLVTSI